MSSTKSCSLTESDWEFVKILTRSFFVNVLSNQVCVSVKPNNLGSIDEENLKFPSNWSLQYVGINLSKYEDNHEVTMTWKVNKL